MAGPEVDVTALVAGGYGLGRMDDGRVVLISGALPGDRVEVEVDEKRSDVVFGHVASVHVASCDRVRAPCPHLHEGCGGCDLMHASVESQGRLKRGIVIDALRRIGHLEAPPVAATVRSVPPTGYRTTLRVGVDGDGCLGLHRRHSSEIVPTPTCLVASQAVRAVLAADRAAPGAELLVRAGAAEGDVLVTDGGRPRGAVVEEVHGRGFLVSAGSFFQSGPAAAELLVDVIDEALPPHVGDGTCLADLYAGVGVIGACLADRHPGVALTAVESQRSAVADLRKNLHDVAGSRVIAAEVAKSDAWLGHLGADSVAVADPARPGLGRSTVAAFGRAEFGALVLASCDPASLGRDVVLLQAAGYRLDVVHVLDLFPHTSHVEAVSVWSRAKP